MYVQVLGARYYLVSFLDESSRMIVHWELLPNMEAHSVSLAAQAAIERLPRDPDGRPLVTPEVRSDNGSGYVSAEFRTVLRENGLGRHRIRPHCPEENGLIERTYRTLREELDGETLATYWQARDALAKVIYRYNHERLHSALGWLGAATAALVDRYLISASNPISLIPACGFPPRRQEPQTDSESGGRAPLLG